MVSQFDSRDKELRAVRSTSNSAQELNRAQYEKTVAELSLGCLQFSRDHKDLKTPAACSLKQLPLASPAKTGPSASSTPDAVLKSESQAASLVQAETALAQLKTAQACAATRAEFGSEKVDAQICGKYLQQKK